ncbi:MAG: hypothetical protein MZV49_18840 [Rhodopseudomonas palustris]|nr:hypothetical protein [Rhodopseudomonas palustris]
MQLLFRGLDAFVFTAGIGENSVRIRSKVVERLSWLGAKLDPGKKRTSRTVHLKRRQSLSDLHHSH